MNPSLPRARLAIIAVAAVALMVFAIRDATMASASFDPKDLLFVIAIYGIPFLVFVFMVWMGRWSELKQRNKNWATRQMIALAAECTGLIAAGMCLLNLPLWSSLASNELFGEFWMITGMLASIVAVLCAVAGSPRLWRQAIASALLLPFWVVLAGLLLKTILD